LVQTSVDAASTALRWWRAMQWRLRSRRVMQQNAARRMPTNDRAVLEQMIFRDLYVGRRYRRILFVGCSEFTSWYPMLFAASGAVFETVDSDPAKRQFGSPSRHFVAPFESLGQRRELHGAYDLVVLNGVFGYGIDSADAKRAALETAHALVGNRGRVLIGFRDRPEGSDLEPGLIDPRMFSAADIPGLGSPTHQTTHVNGHAFVCYEKLA
jgi:hypothetical protein